MLRNVFEIYRYLFIFIIIINIKFYFFKCFPPLCCLQYASQCPEKISSYFTTQCGTIRRSSAQWRLWTCIRRNWIDCLFDLVTPFCRDGGRFLVFHSTQFYRCIVYNVAKSTSAIVYRFPSDERYHPIESGEHILELD